MAGAREMIEQRGNHLFESHRDGAATGADRQRFLPQIGNVTGVGILRRESGREDMLQTRKTSSMILEAGKRRVASKIAM